MAWRITRRDGGLIWFAAVWDVWTAPGGQELAQVATVTCPPSADVRDIHHRMGVILEKNQLSIWLHGEQAEAAALMQPYGEGQLDVSPVTDVDWSAP